MKKKLPDEFVKYDPVDQPTRVMYVRIEALIPVFDHEGRPNGDEIAESLDSAMDALAMYGEGFVTEQYEIVTDQTVAYNMIRERRTNGDTTGETC